MFNPLDYIDNIEYCEYVYNKNNELDLGLKSPQEIQFVANKYINEVCARRGEIEELYADDKLLIETLKKQSKMFKKFRPMDNEIVIENSSVVHEEYFLNENDNLKKSR